MQVKKHSSRGIARVRDVQRAASQIPHEPGINGAEGEFAAIGSFARAGNMIEEPANFASRKVGIDDEAGLVLNQFGLSGFLQAFAEIGGSAILPDDGVMNRGASLAIPNDSGFALIGDAKSRDIITGEFGFGENITGDSELGVPDFAWVVLNPAGFGEDLLKFLLGDRMDLTAPVEEDGPGTGCPLIES